MTNNERTLWPKTKLAPLAIVQARIGSQRLPRKMLLRVAGKPLIWFAWNAAVRAFGRENVVIAMPATPENDELETEVLSMDAGVLTFRWDGPEWDVLGRFWHCAHVYRWHPDSVIVRVTPDDPFKDPGTMCWVAMGERHPVEFGGEAFTLRMLDNAQETEPTHFEVDDDDCTDGLDPVSAVKWEPNEAREHITMALFETDAPYAPEGIWTVDTRADYEAVRHVLLDRIVIKAHASQNRERT